MFFPVDEKKKKKMDHITVVFNFGKRAYGTSESIVHVREGLTMVYYFIAIRGGDVTDRYVCPRAGLPL